MIGDDFSVENLVASGKGVCGMRNNLYKNTLQCCSQ